MTQSPSPHGRRVLIIEDEFLIALDLEATMFKLGFDVCALAPSAGKARALAMCDQPDVAVSQANGRNGSTKGSLSSTVSGPGSRNALDADAFRSTNASLRTQPTEPDARGRVRATGLAKTSRSKAYA